jgi:S1-C subfamily serine protease
VDARTARIVLITLAATFLVGVSLLIAAGAGFVVGRVTAPQAAPRVERPGVLPTPGARIEGAGMAVRILEVIPGSPAEAAGLQPGDRILAVDGAQLGLPHDLADLIGRHSPGERVVLEVERPGQGEPYSVRVRLAENPDHPGEPFLGIRYEWVPWLLPPDPERPPSNRGAS